MREFPANSVMERRMLSAAKESEFFKCFRLCSTCTSLSLIAARNILSGQHSPRDDH